MRRSLLAAVVAVASLVLVSGVVIGAAKLVVPTADGLFWACYDSKGDVRFISSPDQGCPKKWSGPVHWKQAEDPLTTRRVVESGTAPAGDYGDAIAACPTGEVVLGGGYRTESIHPDVHAFTNQPQLIGGVQGWQVTVINESPVDIEFLAFAICAPGISSDFGVDH